MRKTITTSFCMLTFLILSTISDGKEKKEHVLSLMLNGKPLTLVDPGLISLRIKDPPIVRVKKNKKRNVLVFVPLKRGETWIHVVFRPKGIRRSIKGKWKVIVR